MRTRDKSHRVGFCVPFACLVYAVIVIALTLAGCSSYSHSHSQNNVPPWRREYSDAEWLEMVKQPEHQPTIIWKGESRGDIDSKGQWGMSIDGYVFWGTPAEVLDWQLATYMFNGRPLLFLPLFESKDPDVVLTGIYIYDKLSRLIIVHEDKVQFVSALRKAIDHSDTRVRYAVIERLARERCLSIHDLDRGLTDEAVIVCNLTASFVRTVFENRLYHPPRNTDSSDTQMRAMTLSEIKREMAPVLLEHLNDPSFFVRAKCGSTIRNSLASQIDKKTGGHRFDWVKADWQSRVDTQKRWKDWWAKNGEVALHGRTSQVTARN